MTTITDTIQNFPDLFADAGHKVTYPTDTLTQALAAIERTPLSECSSGDLNDRMQAKAKAMAQVVTRFIAARISQTFPLLDNRLFNRRRWIKLAFEGDSAKVVEDRLSEPDAKRTVEDGVQVRWLDLPLLAEYDPSRGSRGAEHIQLASVKWPGGPRHAHCMVRASFPGIIGPKQQRLGDEAVALAHEAMADLYRIPIAADVVRNSRFSYRDSPSLKAYWIPPTEYLELGKEVLRPQGDPALVLDYFGNRYLAALWDVEGEEPLEALLREFSEGSVTRIKEQST